ncbi:hypothetical protein [Variovorax saccharolyticus]|uniref:hypothetical protein n=1 Tax=Variovorax saccharolyticus TaxID=3053516 RepID=UPI0025779346|nr:hypothetical protein [Variovorax sp. J22R187]MDM0021483.1 hypothetical protein [Variovorax sp. J22R187]
MSDSSSPSIPWAGIAVVVALVSSTLLVPRAFDQLRPPEKERAQLPDGVELEIDARLWEDPFFALRRFETERADRCAKAAPKGSAAGDLAPECQATHPHEQREPARFVADRLADKNRDGDRDETLIIAALVPGNPFVGAEENRRRTRYALLAGLQSQGYVSDNADRIGLLQFVTRNPPDAPPSALTIPYELLSERPQLRGDAPAKEGSRFAQVALLWIDEAALKSPKLDSFASLIDELFAKVPCKHPRLAIVGPSSSDALRVALADLTRASRTLPPTREQAAVLKKIYDGCPAAAQEALKTDITKAEQDAAVANDAGETRQPLDWKVRRGYAYLAQAEFLNAGATAADNQLEELETQKLQKHLNAKFGEILGATLPPEVRFKRMVATDSTVLKRFVKELQLRLPSSAGGGRRRIVLVAERDSLYAQALVSELKFRMLRDSPELTDDLSFEVVYFFRGLDGVTTRDAAQKSEEPRGGGSADAATRAAQAIEWPEARDQLDYLRRMVAWLKDSEAPGKQGPISGIGILASDVHDKLLVLQALHEPFADKVFFTTDMDARYLHPRTMSFTRNLIVASSLPLKLASTGVEPREPAGAAPVLERRAGLQSGTPPMRDMYQTATYLAARRAACRDKGCVQDEDRATQKVLDAPSVYEIGRSRAVPLAGYAFEARLTESNGPRAALAAALYTLLAAVLLIWPSTPVLRRARSALLPAAAGPAAVRGIGLPSALIVGLHFALLAFALCSVIELIEPGHLGFISILVITALAGIVAAFGLFPAAARRFSAPPEPDRSGVTTRRWLISVGVPLCALLVAWAWMAWRAMNPAPCVDCEPVEWLEGVSAWPSHLVHLLALFVIACALDYSWSKTLDATAPDTRWLALDRAAKQPATSDGGDLARLWAQLSIAGWKRPRDEVDFSSLWWGYVERGQALGRGLRTLFWYVVTVGLAATLFLVFNDGQVPVVPVRGAEHRALFGWTLGLCVLLLALLIVAVADATMLTCRFLWHLDRARTRYPPETVKQFAQALGPEHVALWTEGLAADPAARGPALADARTPHHSLLDDWIDVQVVARRTKLIAPLVIWPFVVLAMLVVARSRLFDNWSLNLPIAVAAGACLLWLIVIAMLLKSAAERVRTSALQRMEADLRWLTGSPRHAALVEPFKALIEAVKRNQTGAFAGFFDQPLFKALLVPLGGAGGAQLFDYLLLAR